MMTPSDIRHEDTQELIRLCQDDDDLAFRELMEKYINMAFVMAFQYSRDRHSAEDIVQDSFFKIWKNIKRFKLGSRFEPWLFQIVRNTSLDSIKKNKREVVFSDIDNNADDICFAEEIPDDQPSIYVLMTRQEDSELIKKILNELHPDQKTTLLMKYDMNMTFEEISKVFNKPMNTVKSWHNRALIKMRKIWDMHQKHD